MRPCLKINGLGVSLHPEDDSGPRPASRRNHPFPEPGGVCRGEAATAAHIPAARPCRGVDRRLEEAEGRWLGALNTRRGLSRPPGRLNALGGPEPPNGCGPHPTLSPWGGGWPGAEPGRAARGPRAPPVSLAPPPAPGGAGKGKGGATHFGSAARSSLPQPACARALAPSPAEFNTMPTPTPCATPRPAQQPRRRGRGRPSQGEGMSARESRRQRETRRGRKRACAPPPASGEAEPQQ